MAKFKLELEDFGNAVDTALGILSLNGALKLCYELNKSLGDVDLKRSQEDLYLDYKGHRFFFRVWHFFDELREYEIRLAENRSYRSIAAENHSVGLFDEPLNLEKNWLSSKEGFNFFLWFEGNKENVDFTLSWLSKLKSCSGIQQVKELKGKSLSQLNNTIKYYNGL